MNLRVAHSNSLSNKKNIHVHHTMIDATCEDSGDNQSTTTDTRTVCPALYKTTRHHAVQQKAHVGLQCGQDPHSLPNEVRVRDATSTVSSPLNANEVILGWLHPEMRTSLSKPYYWFNCSRTVRNVFYSNVGRKPRQIIVLIASIRYDISRNR